jgi:hypothetical protein
VQITEEDLRVARRLGARRLRRELLPSLHLAGDLGGDRLGCPRGALDPPCGAITAAA